MNSIRRHVQLSGPHVIVRRKIRKNIISVNWTFKNPNFTNFLYRNVCPLCSALLLAAVSVCMMCAAKYASFQDLNMHALKVTACIVPGAKHL